MLSASTRRVALLVPFLVLVLFEVVYRKSSAVFFVAGLLPLLFIGTIVILLGGNLKTPAARVKFMVVPLALTWSALAFTLLVETALLRHVLAVIVALFLILFFESILTYIWHHETYTAFSLENLSGYALTLTVFLGSSSLTGLYILLDLPIWSIVVAAALLFSAVHYTFFWMSKLTGKTAQVFVVVLMLLTLEQFLVLLFLPMHFFITGAVNTVSWYTAILISRAHLIGVLNRKMLARHLSLGGALTGILFIASVLL